MDPESFDPEFFTVGEFVEYNMTTSNYDSAPRGWFVGIMKEIDENDPSIPWRVLVAQNHHRYTHEVDGACWFRHTSVRKLQYVIQELP